MANSNFNMASVVSPILPQKSDSEVTPQVREARKLYKELDKQSKMLLSMTDKVPRDELVRRDKELHSKMLFLDTFEKTSDTLDASAKKNLQTEDFPFDNLMSKGNLS